jgi:hypothetical protein
MMVRAALLRRGLASSVIFVLALRKLHTVWAGKLMATKLDFKSMWQTHFQVEYRLTLKGHHKCVATVPLVRNPSYDLLAGFSALQSVFTSLHRTGFSHYA